MKGLICIQAFLSNIIQSKLSAIRILLQSHFWGIVPEGVQEKSLLILGNGPSLNQTFENNPIETVKSFDLLAVNAAALSSEYENLTPKYYLLNAVTYFQEDQDLSEYYIKDRKQLFEAIAKKTSWEMNLLVPFRAKKSRAFAALIRANSNLKVAYFNQTPVEGLKFWSHLWYKWGWGMPRPHNVLIPSLMVGMRMGYKTIAIVGADHSWLADLSVNEHNEAMMRHVHYYATEGTQPMKVEDRQDRPRTLHEIIHKFYLSFKGYWQIKAFAEKRGKRIYNASHVSMIDAFERKKLAEILSEKGHK